MSSFLMLSRRSLLAALAVGPLAAWSRPRLEAPAPALALALEAAADVDPAGFLVSEKYDGARALWDGQSLRFRSGLKVCAPTWFTDSLPKDQVMDGELWAGRGRFQALAGAVRRHRPLDGEWQALRYMVFDLPQAAGDFAQRSASLLALAGGAQRQASAPWLAVPQAHSPNRAALQQRLAEVVAAGGEGLMLQLAHAPYRPGRSGCLLKLKPLHDAEALVLGQLPGRGKHAGRMGALHVRTAQGTEFKLGTGFSDAERETPPPPGTWLTYSHRGFTDAGLPRFASFLRLRDGF